MNVGKILFPLRHHGRHLGFSLRKRGLGGEARDPIRAVTRPTARTGFVQSVAHPQLRPRRRKVESVGHDPNYFGREPVDRDRGAQHRRLPTETALPQRLGKHHVRIGSRSIVVGRENTPEQWRYAEDVKEVGGRHNSL